MVEAGQEIDSRIALRSLLFQAPERISPEAAAAAALKRVLASLEESDEIEKE